MSQTKLLFSDCGPYDRLWHKPMPCSLGINNCIIIIITESLPYITTVCTISY